jgi:hypothetical protein
MTRNSRKSRHSVQAQAREIEAFFRSISPVHQVSPLPRAAAGLEIRGPYSPPHGLQGKGFAFGAVSPAFGRYAACQAG